MGTIQLFNHPIKMVYLLLIVAEGALLLAAVHLGVYLRFVHQPAAMTEFSALGAKAALFAGVVMLAMVSVGLYNRRLRDGMGRVLLRLGLALLLGGIALLVVFYCFPQLSLGGGVLALVLLAAFALLVLSRLLFRRLLELPRLSRRVLVLGAGKRAHPLTMLRRRSDLIGFHIVGYLPTPGDQPMVPEERQLHGGSLEELVRRERIEQIVVAVDDRRRGLPMEELLRCRTNGIEVIDVLSFLEQETGQIRLDLLYPGWLTFSRGFHRGWLRRAAKRTFDLVVSLAMLILTSPIMALTALAIVVESGWPVLYRQQRVGEGGRLFSVYKFRSMRPDAEKDGKARWAQPNDPRVTRVGAFIRKYRIDELPQIYNVLRGDMSFIGPRPERPEFVQGLQRKLPYYVERHRVKPGLTGWAQICYPYGASDDDAFEKLQYDLYYVKNHSLFLDLAILLQTAEVVLWGRGAR